MQLSLFVAGKARQSPENELCMKFLGRIERQGGLIGFRPVVMKEYDPATPTRWLESAIKQSRTHLCALDERGEMQSSADFANMLAEWRDDGLSEAIFLIGGPNGINRSIKAQADRIVSFGRMTFPHMMARAMLTEQLYRAVSILRGEPYHRE